MNKEYTDGMQQALVDLIDLHNTGKQAHWNIVGTNFRDIHLNLDEMVVVARDAADAVAERMRAMKVEVDGRIETVAAKSSLEKFPAGLISTTDAVDKIVKAIETACKTIRKIHDGVEKADLPSGDLLIEQVIKLEQQAWFLRSETDGVSK